jgi:hypothetical protein
MSENKNSSHEHGMKKYFFRASAEDFGKIPGSPIAYWISEPLRNAFLTGKPLGSISEPRTGLQTGENEKFVRYWYEVSHCRSCFESGVDKAIFKWFPYNKGGDFRKWYGNADFVLNWEGDGRDIKQDKLDKLAKGLCLPSNSKPKNQQYYFRECASWTKISSSRISLRYFPDSFIFDIAGCAVFSDSQKKILSLIGFLNTNISIDIFRIISPTLNYQPGDVSNIPIVDSVFKVDTTHIERLISYAKSDWDSYETSWDFNSIQLLHSKHKQITLKASYHTLRAHWREMTMEMQLLEEENNRIFIEAYGLQEELTPEVPLNEITLTCNPHYRFGSVASDQGLVAREEELEARLLTETMKELVSYAVGCMFGRYSLDMPGLVLANQGETVEEYRRKLADHHNQLTPNPSPLTPESVEISFPPDADNVIPMLDSEWFNDDITERFQRFLRVAFGEAHYEENLQFVEQGLNLKGKRNYSIRDYFLGEFYTDHVRRYKKRPIYWLFSSPKGSFNALIYMHRYRPDTVSVVLRYLRDFRKKLADEKDRQASASINPAVSQGDRTRALKETDRLNKVLAELDDYERDVIYPLATQQIEIDLDDGVKVNYLKFGAALKKIVGLEAKDED